MSGGRPRPVSVERPAGVPETMRAVVTRAPGDVVVEEMPVPAIGPGDLLVRPAVVGICAGDTAPWYVERKAPAVLGHEPAGTVVAVGEDVEGFAPGDRVFFHHHAPCMRCRDCQRGHYTLCPTWRSSHLDPGGLAELVRVPAPNLVDCLHLPEGMSFEAASLVEPLACCVKALRRLAIRPGESVVVIGLGAMGQMLAALARALGAAPIIGTDFVASRRDAALASGCDVALDAARADLADAVRAANQGRLADVVMVGPGDAGALRAGLELTGPGGRWCCFWPTPAGEELPINPHDLYFGEVTLHFSYSCGPDDTREALTWIHRGVVRPEHLITHRVPFEEASRAFDLTRRAAESLKAVIVFP